MRRIPIVLGIVLFAAAVPSVPSEARLERVPQKVAKAGEPCAGATAIPCAEGLLCDRTEVQNKTCVASDQRGVCVVRPEVCTEDYKPVCGCDGKTYSNDCARRAAAAPRAHVGECK